MLNARPPIVTVPVRAAPVLAATVIPTEPLPLPLPPDVSVNHWALLTAAVQLQPAGAVTATGSSAPPAAATAWLARLISYEQDSAAGGDGGGGGEGAGVGVGGTGGGGAGAAGGAGFSGAACWLTV